MSHFRMRQGERQGKVSDLRCGQCTRELYGGGVEWSFAGPTMVFHPSCAQHLGLSLIGDARSAGYVSGNDSSKPIDMRERPMRCSFCGKPRKTVERLIAGPRVYICGECIGLCNEIIEEDQEPNPEHVTKPLRDNDPVMD